MRIPQLCVLMSGLLGLSCQDAPTTPRDAYPTILMALSAQDLEGLRSEYAALNPGYCTTLDEFGFAQWSYTCGSSDPIDCSADSMIVLAKSEIVRNAQFTGVAEIDQLRVRIY